MTRRIREASRGGLRPFEAGGASRLRRDSRREAKEEDRRQKTEDAEDGIMEYLNVEKTGRRGRQKTVD